MLGKTGFIHKSITIPIMRLTRGLMTHWFLGNDIISNIDNINTLLTAITVTGSLSILENLYYSITGQDDYKSIRKKKKGMISPIMKKFSSRAFPMAVISGVALDYVLEQNGIPSLQDSIPIFLTRTTVSFRISVLSIEGGEMIGHWDSYVSYEELYKRNKEALRNDSSSCSF